MWFDYLYTSFEVFWTSYFYHSNTATCVPIITHKTDVTSIIELVWPSDNRFWRWNRCPTTNQQCEMYDSSIILAHNVWNRVEWLRPFHKGSPWLHCEMGTINLPCAMDAISVVLWNGWYQIHPACELDTIGFASWNGRSWFCLVKYIVKPNMFITAVIIDQVTNDWIKVSSCCASIFSPLNIVNGDVHGKNAENMSYH